MKIELDAAQRVLRPGLARELVVRTALEIADREGLDGLSLRNVARELNVTPMALYRHIGSKEELCEAVADLAFSEFRPPAGSGDWRQDLRQTAREYRRLLLAHPAMPALLSERQMLFTEHTMRAGEIPLRILHAAGFAPPVAVLLFDQSTEFVLALVLRETMAACCGDKFTQAAEERVRALPASEFPHVVEAAPYTFTQPNFDDAFEFALDILVAGMEAKLKELRG